MTVPSTRTFPSRARIAAVARVRIIRVLRMRLGTAALLITLAPWLLVNGVTLYARLSALAQFTLAGLTVLAAGAVADDVESGEYAILLTHGASPMEVLAGAAVASFALGVILIGLQLPIAMRGVDVAHTMPVLHCIAWLTALLASWLAMMLFFATILEGKANAIAMIAVLIVVPVGLSSGLLERIPAAPAAVVRGVLQVMPRLDHVNEMFRAVLYRSPVSPLAPIVLLASPIVYFALAALRLNRLESAGRLTQ